MKTNKIFQFQKLNAAVALLIVVFSLSVTNAQDLVKFTAYHNYASDLLTISEAADKNTDSAAESVNSAEFIRMSALMVAEKEEPLTVEDWMTDETKFYPVSQRLSADKEKDKPEIQLAEEVLSTDGNANPAGNQDNQVQLNDKSQKRKFGIRTFSLIEEKDSEAKIEFWMLDYRLWNPK
jgi:hypothetical protein